MPKYKVVVHKKEEAQITVDASNMLECVQKVDRMFSKIPEQEFYVVDYSIGMPTIIREE